MSLTWMVASHLHTDRQVLTLYCEFDLGGEGFGSHPVGGLTPVHRHTYTQVLTLYCEFDLGGEGFGSHPVGGLTVQTDRQRDRQVLTLYCELTWVVRGLGVTLLEASHLYTDRQTCTYTVLWVWPGWWGVWESPCWKPHTCTQTNRHVLTLYCEFDLGGEGFGGHHVGSLTPAHRQTDRQTCTYTVLWVWPGWSGLWKSPCWRPHTCTQTYIHTGTYTVLWVWPGWGGVWESPSWRPHTCTQTDRHVLTLYCEFDLGGEGFGSHPVGSLTPVHSLVFVWSDGQDEFILRFAEATLVGEVDLFTVLVPEAKLWDPC